MIDMHAKFVPTIKTVQDKLGEYTDNFDVYM